MRIFLLKTLSILFGEELKSSLRRLAIVKEDLSIIVHFVTFVLVLVTITADFSLMFINSGKPRAFLIGHKL